MEYTKIRNIFKSLEWSPLIIKWEPVINEILYQALCSSFVNVKCIKTLCICLITTKETPELYILPYVNHYFLYSFSLMNTLKSFKKSSFICIF